jgi:processive 1,2-diacylglycerol beta-glucosyltransferase
MPRVLILTASYGSGHNVAAASLAAAFEDAGAQPLVVDHFRDLVHPVFARASRGLYHWVLRRVPLAWGAAYAVGDRLASDSRLTFGATRVGADRLARLLEAARPDAVVTVHATPAVVMAELAASGLAVPPHTTVVTDFVAHGQWIAGGIDRYCVAAPEVKHHFVARGIPAWRIAVTGVPVRREFAVPVDSEAARAELGLSSRWPVVLAMAGSHGALGRLPDVARALAAVEGRCQGVVVAGRDARLVATLRGIVGAAPVRVLGHVANVRALMAAADVLVTKAGGMTLAEGMAAEVPMVLYGSLPGQERRNERFAARNGVALVAASRAELARVLERALGDPALLDDVRANIERLRRPDASRRVVQAVLSGVPERA